MKPIPGTRFKLFLKRRQARFRRLRPIGLSQLFGRSLPYSNLIRGNLDELFGEIGGTNYWDSVMPQKLVIPSWGEKNIFPMLGLMVHSCKCTLWSCLKSIASPRGMRYGSLLCSWKIINILEKSLPIQSWQKQPLQIGHHQGEQALFSTADSSIQRIQSEERQQ